jgi:hypothetical protein
MSKLPRANAIRPYGLLFGNRGEVIRDGWVRRLRTGGEAGKTDRSHFATDFSGPPPSIAAPPRFSFARLTRCGVSAW